MKKIFPRLLLIAASVTMSLNAVAQEVDSTQTATVITLDDALKIALSENASVRVADKEIERVGYAKKGTYASLFPQIDITGSFMRTIKKQVMYMDMDMSDFMGGGSSSGSGSEGSEGGSTGSGSGSTGSETSSPMAGMPSGGGIEVGRWNTYNLGVSASMPLINAQLWKSLKISGQNVELAIEKARSSRLDMVTQVKQAYYAVLLAKEALNVYKDVYDNAVKNFEQTQMRYNAQKASELDYTRAKSTVANAIPNVYNAESSVILALWQLKAVMGVSLDQDIDVAGTLGDYSDTMATDNYSSDALTLDYNTTMRQLAIQADQLAETVKMQKYAYIPSLALTFSYSLNAMTNDFKFSDYRWTPYSYVGLSLNIPIFSGGKRYNDVRQAQAQASELAIQVDDTERQLKIAIRQYLNTMETKMKSLAAAEDGVETAQKAYDIATQSYNVGRSTITELNDAQLALTQSKLAVSQSIYEYVVAKSSLEQILGHDFIDDYWFKTGSPTYLVRLLAHSDENINELVGKYYPTKDFDDYKATVERPLPMIYQSGYLTIKGWSRNTNSYLLDFPNDEVRRGFISLLAADYLKPKVSPDSWVLQVIEALGKGECEKLHQLMVSFFASIPYSQRRKDDEREKERYFQYTFYLVLRMISSYTIFIEKEQSEGRVDCIIETPLYIYIFEFKRDGSAKEALQQIEDMGYAREYFSDKRKIFKIGCSFSSKTGTIDDWGER